MTSVDRSLISFDQLGVGVHGCDPIAVANAYAKAGVAGDTLRVAVAQILFDAVVGNRDRLTNNSNWAVFMDNVTGVRRLSWSYDFNWSNLLTKDIDLMKQVKECVKRNHLETLSCNFLKPIINVCSKLDIDIWKENAQDLLVHFDVSPTPSLMRCDDDFEYTSQF